MNIPFYKSTSANLFALIIPAIIITFQPMNAREIYVSKNGSDNNIGTISSPFRSIQKATEIITAGDTVNINPGVYNETVVVRDKKGQRDNPIYIKGRGKVIVTKSGDLSFNNSNINKFHPYDMGGIFRLENCKHITVDGIEVQDSSWFGLAARNCDHLTIQYCVSQNSMASGIYVLDSENVKINHNEIIRACAKIGRIGEHGSQECLSVVNTKYFEVAYNQVHESGTWLGSEDGGSGVGGEGIDVKEDSHYGIVHHNYIYNLSRLGLYCDAWASNLSDVDFYCNVVRDTKAGIALSCEAGGTLHNIKVYNNLIYHNRKIGLVLSSWGMSGTKKDILIANNTIYRNAAGGIYLGSSLHHNIRVINNLLWSNGFELSFEQDYDKGEAQNVVSANNLTGVCPEFVDIENGDLRLKGNSPAIDAGSDDFDFTSVLDIKDGIRIIGSAIDIGAFEYQED